MNKPILGIVVLQQDYYVPFSNIKLRCGDKIQGYYDGASITFFNNNVLNTYYLCATKHQFNVENTL